MSFKIKRLKDIILKNNIEGFKVHSKDVNKNDLFFALKGNKTDGHNFVKEASEKGAFLSVVEEGYRAEGLEKNKIFKVNGVLKTLQELGKSILKKKRLLGITGSFGKTTTKDFIYSLLKEEFQIAKSFENYNSQIGLFLSALNMEKDVNMAVLEMGISRVKEMENFLRVLKLDMAVLLNVSFSHVGNFKNFKALLLEKMKIFKNCPIKIINYDLVKFVKKTDFITFSMKEKRADFFLEEKEKKTFTIYENGKRVFNFFFENSFFSLNFLAAYAACRMLKVDPMKIKEKIRYLKPPKMRWEKIKKGGVLFILDCYNSNPFSIIWGFKNLPHVKGKKIAFFGPMKELGKFSKSLHQKVGEAANKFVDVLLTFEEESFYFLEKFKKEKAFFLSKKKAFEYLNKIIYPEDLVFIKGARSCKMEDFFKEMF